MTKFWTGRSGIRCLAVETFCCSQKLPGQVWWPPSHLLIEYWGLFPPVLRRPWLEADHSRHLVSMWSMNASTPLYTFKAGAGTNFPFPLRFGVTSSFHAWDGVSKLVLVPTNRRHCLIPKDSNFHSRLLVISDGEATARSYVSASSSCSRQKRHCLWVR